MYVNAGYGIYLLSGFFYLNGILEVVLVHGIIKYYGNRICVKFI